MPTAYLSLGSNLGDRASHLSLALERLEGPAVRVDRVSSRYETEPVGETASPVPGYLNLVARVETTLSPQELLDRLHSVEHAGGRERTYLWAPRTIDLDLLMYDDAAMETDTLVLPHPRMLDRAFVLVPLMEIAPGLVFADGSTLQGRVKSTAIANQNVTRLISQQDQDKV